MKIIFLICFIIILSNRNIAQGTYSIEVNDNNKIFSISKDNIIFNSLDTCKIDFSIKNLSSEKIFVPDFNILKLIPSYTERYHTFDLTYMLSEIEFGLMPKLLLLDIGDLIEFSIDIDFGDLVLEIKKCYSLKFNFSFQYIKYMEYLEYLCDGDDETVQVNNYHIMDIINSSKTIIIGPLPIELFLKE